MNNSFFNALRFKQGHHMLEEKSCAMLTTSLLVFTLNDSMHLHVPFTLILKVN